MHHQHRLSEIKITNYQDRSPVCDKNDKDTGYL